MFDPLPGLGPIVPPSLLLGPQPGDELPGDERRRPLLLGSKPQPLLSHLAVVDIAEDVLQATQVTLEFLGPRPQDRPRRA